MDLEMGSYRYECSITSNLTNISTTDLKASVSMYIDSNAICKLI